ALVFFDRELTPESRIARAPLPDQDELAVAAAAPFRPEEAVGAVGNARFHGLAFDPDDEVILGDVDRMGDGEPADLIQTAPHLPVRAESARGSHEVVNRGVDIVRLGFRAIQEPARAEWSLDRNLDANIKAIRWIPVCLP